MTSKEIRGEHPPRSDRRAGTMQYDSDTNDYLRFQGEMLREIAAQLADLNENLKGKSLTAHCDAHVYIGGGREYEERGK